MAITTVEELQNRALLLVPPDTPYNMESVARTIYNELQEGGMVLTDEQIASALRKAYNEPFWTVAWVKQLRERYNFT